GDEIEELYRLAEAVDARISVRDRARGGERRESQRQRGDSAVAIDRQGLWIHWQFHRRIAEESRQPVLVRQLERIEVLWRIEASWSAAPQLTSPPRLHSLPVDPIAGRAPEAAEAVMRAHVRRGLEKELLAYRMSLDE